jgi:hypothetical protein
MGRVDVVGCEKLTPEQIRAGLWDSTEVQLASTPSAKLADFLDVLQRQTVLGYRCGGFPDAEVKVVEKGARIEISVVEGRRCAAGEIRLKNAPNVDGGQVTKLVTTRDRAARLAVRVNPFDGSIQLKTLDKPVKRPPVMWSPGEPAPFDVPTDQRLAEVVREALAHQGLFWPEFKLTRTIVGDKAELLIDFAREGPRASLGEIEIRGANRNKPEEVIRFLKLEQGMRIDVPAIERIHRRLWNSGRFFRHDLMAKAASDGSGRVKLTIELEEHEKATRLAEELTPVEMSMLRCRDWLAKALEGDEDLTAVMSDGQTKGMVVLNARSGVAARVTSTAAGAIVAGEMGMVLTGRMVGAFSTSADRRFVMPPGDWGVYATVDFVPALGGPGGQRVNFVVGAGIETSRAGKPFALTVTLAPVCFIDLAHGGWQGGKVEHELKDGVFRVKLGDVTFAFKAETGEFLEITGKSGVEELRVTASRGALARAVKEIEGGTSPNAYDPKRPVSSAVAFLGEVWCAIPLLTRRATPEQRKTAAGAVRKMMASRAIGELGEPWARFAPSQRFTDFFVPADVSGLVASGAGPMSVLGEVVPWCDFFFERGSWPWTMAREAMLVASGRAKHTDSEARRIYQSAEVGPVGFLVAASLYARANDGATARLFAKRGLERLTLEAFGKDCRTLLQNGSAQAAALSAVVESVREVNDAEVDALAAVLPAGYGKAFRALAAFGRAGGKGAEVLPETLQRTLWEGGMKELLEGALGEIANAR